MADSQITYTPRPDATPEAELNTLAAVYMFILNCRTHNEGGPATAPDSPKGGSENVSSADTSIPE